MTVKDIAGLSEQYLSDLRGGALDAWGPRASAYSVSKACVNALTATLARENPGLVVNCCCPGWVDTDMGGIVGKPPKTPAEGARIPVRLAFGKIDGVTGRYWSNPGISDTGEGRVAEW